LDLIQTLNSFSLRGVECFFQNFNIIGFAAKELHLSKVEGVETVCIFFQI